MHMPVSIVVLQFLSCFFLGPLPWINKSAASDSVRELHRSPLSHENTLGPVYIAATDLNLYKDQTTASAIILQIPKGATVKVVDSRNSRWWQIQYKSRTGYTLSKDLQYSSRNDHLDYDPIINASSLYDSRPSLEVPSQLELYEHPVTSSAVLTRLSRGISVKVIDSSNPDWLFVHYKGRTGYLQQRQLSVANQPLSASRPTSVEVSPGGEFRLTKETSLRMSPDSKARVLLRFSVGDVVSVLENSGEWWWKVAFEGKEGWVKRRLLEKN